MSEIVHVIIQYFKDYIKHEIDFNLTDAILVQLRNNTKIHHLKEKHGAIV